MGVYKDIYIQINDIKIELYKILIGYAIVVLILAFFSVGIENKELLKQVDEAMGENNELKFSNEKLNKENEELKKEYERLVDYIRTSDKYEMPEGMEK